MTVSPEPIQARPTADEPSAVLPYGRPGRRRFRLPPYVGAVVVALVLGVITAYVEPSFRKPQNLVNIAQNQASVGILAVGMTLVIIGGGIDLSVGSLVALAGGVGILVVDGVGRRMTGKDGDVSAFRDWTTIVLAIGATLGVGLAAGLVNGLLVAKGRLPAFLVTLATLLALRSAGQWIANGGQFVPEHYHGTALASVGGSFAIPHTVASVTRRGKVLPVTVLYEVGVWAVVAVAASVVLNRTRLGRYAVAVGGNPRAARYSAVPVARVRVVLFAISGLLAGVAGLMEAARYSAINSGNTGQLLELYAIAAAVIGGARLEGGVGSVFGAVVGALLLGLINNMVSLLGVNSQAQGVVLGVIILVAALAQRQKSVA